MFALAMRMMPAAAASTGIPNGSATPLADGRARRLDVDLHRTAEEPIGMQAAEDDVGVRHRRLRAAAAVRRGTGIGPRAVRADVQALAFVEPGDAAGAGPDGIDLDHRQLHGMAGHFAVRGHAQLAVVDQRDVGAGAAHVDAQQTARAHRLPDALHRERAAGGAGRDQPDRIIPGGGDGQRSAVRLHQQHVCVRKQPPHARGHLFEVSLDQRHGGRVQRHRAHALELPDLAADVVRGGDAHPGQPLPQPVADPRLVVRVPERVEQADRHRLGRVVPDGLDQRVALRPVGLREDFPRRRGAFADAVPALARHHRERLVLHEVVHVRAEVTPDLQHVAESRGGHQRAFRQLVLQDRVGDQGRAVHEQRDLRGVDGGEPEPALDGLDQRARRVGPAAGDLRDGDLAGLLLQDRDVGEGPADVHAESYAAHVSPLPMPGPAQPEPRHARSAHGQKSNNCMILR